MTPALTHFRASGLAHCARPPSWFASEKLRVILSRADGEGPHGLLLLRRRLPGFLGEALHPLEFCLETTREIVGAVLEKHNETEGEKDKKDEPEKPAKQRHEPMVTYSLSQVNGVAHPP
jgi:hypothetical protein